MNIKNTIIVDSKHLKISFLIYIKVSKFKFNIFLVQYIFYEGPNVGVGHPGRVKKKGARNFIIVPPWAYFHQVNVHYQRLYSPYNSLSLHFHLSMFKVTSLIAPKVKACPNLLPYKCKSLKDVIYHLKMGTRVLIKFSTCEMFLKTCPPHALAYTYNGNHKK